MPILPHNKARYPRDWSLRSRFVRFYRAKNRCEWCGAENGKPHPVTGSRVVLTVAHVFDERPEAAGLMNLARSASVAITGTMRRAARHAAERGWSNAQDSGCCLLRILTADDTDHMDEKP
jgi:hypothetical protein